VVAELRRLFDDCGLSKKVTIEMTTTRKLTQIFRAIADGKLQDAAELANEYCRLEQRKGHRGVARQLRGALSVGRGQSHSQPHGPGDSDIEPSMRGNLFSTALMRMETPRSLSSVLLPTQLRSNLDEIIGEWKQQDKLRRHGIPPRSKLLFHGPPGCGKSLTASALGHELGLPTYVVRFDAVVGAFLGQTAMHLRRLFHFAETTPCVLLLDELDALGKRRGNPLDVGELDRIVISLMQELEHSRPIGLLIGTTNLPNHLDDALWRRFDANLHFSAPTKVSMRQFVRRLEKERGLRLNAKTRAAALSNVSYAGAEQSILAAVRRQILIFDGAVDGK
jgi:AAA+ superfamily predicted ATPase